MSRSHYMRRLSPELKANILKSYAQGKSLNTISAMTGLSKTTIHYHTLKAFGRVYVKMHIDDHPNAQLGEFIGLFAADGCFYSDKKRYQYTLTITLSKYQMAYARLMRRIIHSILGKYPRIDTKRRAIQIVVRGRAILPFLQRYLVWEGRRTHSIRLTSYALGQCDEFLKGIVRGLVAGDGGISIQKPRIYFGVVSKRLALQYAQILTRFKIASHVYSQSYPWKKTLYHVVVGRRSELEKFKLRVGLTDPAKERRLLLVRP